MKYFKYKVGNNDKECEEYYEFFDVERKYIIQESENNRWIELFIENPSLTSIELSEKIGVTKRIIEMTFKSLQEKKIIERIGSKRDGNWIVKGQTNYIYKLKFIVVIWFNDF